MLNCLPINATIPHTDDITKIAITPHIIIDFPSLADSGSPALELIYLTKPQKKARTARPTTTYKRIETISLTAVTIPLTSEK